MTTVEKIPKVSKRRLPGRPKKGIRRSNILMVRLTPTERILIDGKAKTAGMKSSEWFRRSAKQAQVAARFSGEEASWFRMLAGLANNLNQLTHLAHVSGLISLAQKCRVMITQVDEILLKIRNHDR